MCGERIAASDGLYGFAGIFEVANSVGILRQKSLRQTGVL